MTSIIKNGSATSETGKRDDKLHRAVTHAGYQIPLPAPVLAVQMVNCELSDGDLMVMNASPRTYQRIMDPLILIAPGRPLVGSR